MNPIVEDPLPETESRLLFTLLDAADADGSLQGIHRQQWHELKARFDAGTSANLGAALYRLMAEHSATMHVRDSWIQARWRALQARVADSQRTKRGRMASTAA